MTTVKLGGKHANELNYKRYVGEEVTLTNKKMAGGYPIVHIKAKDVPYPIPLAVHPEDIQNG